MRILDNMFAVSCPIALIFYGRLNSNAAEAAGKREGDVMMD